MEMMSKTTVLLMVIAMSLGAIYVNYSITKDCATFGKFQSGTNIYRCKIVEPK